MTNDRGQKEAEKKEKGEKGNVEKKRAALKETQEKGDKRGVSPTTVREKGPRENSRRNFENIRTEDLHSVLVR